MIPIKPRLFYSPFSLSYIPPSVPADAVSYDNAGSIHEGYSQANTSPDPLIIYFSIWLFGAVCTALYFAIRQHRFKQYIRRHGYLCKNTLQTIACTAARMIDVSAPKVLIVPELATPMLTGLFRPTILLPEKEYKDEELRLIFKHELFHFKRHDLWIQLFFLICRTIYWFNPLMLLFNKAMLTDCELACDESVTKDESAAAKKLYCSVLLTSAYESSRLSPVLTGSFGSERKQLKNRLGLILSRGKQRKLGVLGVIVAIAVAFSGTLFSFSVSSSTTPQQIVETTTAVSVAQEELSTVETTTGPSKDVQETWTFVTTTYPYHAPEFNISGEQTSTTVRAETP